VLEITSLPGIGNLAEHLSSVSTGAGSFIASELELDIVEINLEMVAPINVTISNEFEITIENELEIEIT